MNKSQLTNEDRDMTLLERCDEVQAHNGALIRNIGNRITDLIYRLSANSILDPAVDGECGSTPPDTGLLGKLKDNLNYESVLLGEIQSDLGKLESLL